MILRSARRPLLVSGGGVRYSGAAAAVLELATAHGVPVVETVAGRTLLPEPHPLNAGPLGIIGSTSANTMAAEADVVVAIGTRLQDFTTASWTLFSPDVRIIGVNAARFDAVKRGSHEVVGDAREAVRELQAALHGWSADPAWTARAATEKAAWDAHIDTLRGGVAPDGSLTYAQVVGVVNDASGPDDYVVVSSGGMPGELHGGWRSGPVDTAGAPAAHGTSGSTMDLEYGFSCMGYEIAGPWGASIARGRTHPGGVVTTLLGDGSYLMLNSELYSAAFAGHPYVAVVCDNGGYAVIHRLQTGQGAPGFNNLLSDVAGPGGVRVDFAAHARSLGLHGRGRARGCAGRRPRGGVRPGPRGGGAHPPSGGRGVPHPPHDVDRGGRVLGGGRAALACPDARRTTSTRRPRCGGCHEVPAPRGDAAPFSRRDRPGHGDPSCSPARCS